MLPTGHAYLCGDAYKIDDGGTIVNTVTVPGGATEDPAADPGVYDTVSEHLDVQKAEKVNLIVITQGSGVGDTESLLVHIQGVGKAGIWNVGLPIPVYFPVDGENELASSVAVDVMTYQEIRVGKITNPNLGDVTARVVVDYKC